MNEEILDLQSILEIEQTGQYDNETINKLDDYINQSKFATTVEAKKIVDRNNKFGFTTEQTISDIRDLAKNSILDKVYEEDTQRATDVIFDYIGSSLSKETDVVKTFLEHNQNELAQSYAQGGLLSFLRFADGGDFNYKINAGELAQKIQANPQFAARILKDGFKGNQRRMDKFLKQIGEADQSTSYTFGSDKRTVNTTSRDFDASEGISTSYKNDRKPSGLTRLLTAGENKVTKGLDAIQGLVQNSEFRDLFEPKKEQTPEKDATDMDVEDIMDRTKLDRTQLAQKVSKMTGKPLRTIKDKDILAVANKGKLLKGGRLFQQGGINMNSQSKYSDQFKDTKGDLSIGDSMKNNIHKEVARIDSELDAIMQELNKSRETKQSVGGTKSYTNVANNTDLKDKELRRYAETLIAQKKRLAQVGVMEKENMNDSLLTMNKGGMTYKKGGMMNILLKKKVNIN